MLVFCMWSVFIIWFQWLTLTCRAHQYQMDSLRTSSLVFAVDAKMHIVLENWNKIQHYIKSIADEFDKQQSDKIIKDYQFIQNDLGECNFNDIRTFTNKSEFLQMIQHIAIGSNSQNECPNTLAALDQRLLSMLPNAHVYIFVYSTMINDIKPNDTILQSIHMRAATVSTFQCLYFIHKIELKKH